MLPQRLFLNRIQTMPLALHHKWAYKRLSLHTVLRTSSSMGDLVTIDRLVSYHGTS